jgi:hypothetical protein
MAVSDDLPGLAIAGVSIPEIERKIAGALRDFLESSGYTITSINLIRDERFAAPDFGPPAFIAHASLTSCNAA